MIRIHYSKNGNNVKRLLAELASQASEGYMDNPIDYKNRMVTPDNILGAGRQTYYVHIISSVLQEKKNAEILDVGIGYGLYSVILKNEFGFRLSGIDHPFNIDVYCRLPIQMGIPVLGCDLNTDEVPFAAESFDVIIAAEVLEHLIVPPKAVFRKFSKVLKADGKLLITTPNFASLGNILSLTKGDNPLCEFPEIGNIGGSRIGDMRTHPREYTCKEIQKSLETSGFKLVQLRTMIDHAKHASSFKTRIASEMSRFTPRHRDRIVCLAKRKS